MVTINKTIAQGFATGELYGVLNDLDAENNYVAGDTYWVDPSNGNDNNAGTSKDSPLATMQAAIDKCTAGNGDVIVRMPGTETVTSTINFNKGGITVVPQTYGLSLSGHGEYFATLADASFTDGPVATITERCTIVGLGFVSRDTGSTFYSGAAVLIGGDGDANPFGVRLKGCRFPKWNVDNRIGVAIEGSTDCLIEACFFEGVGANFEVGIYVQGATQNLEIKDCRFRQTDYAIEHGAFAGGGPECIYHGNILEDQGDNFLKTGSNAATGILTNNYIPLAKASANDVNISALNALGLYSAGNHYVET